MLSNIAFRQHALELGVKFVYGETAHKVLSAKGKATGVVTESGLTFHAPIVVDATGGWDGKQQHMVNSGLQKLPVAPDSHEAGITEPVAKFFEPMIVDLRPRPLSKNFYFYQNVHGQVVFCVTPDPLLVGTDQRETSLFLPQVCRRLVEQLPRLRNLRVRRVWRGLYPMSPDGNPLVGWNRHMAGLIHATGMCGQGFMLGPGLGETIARAALRGPAHPPSLTAADPVEKTDAVILKEFDLYREFKGMEALK